MIIKMTFNDNDFTDILYSFAKKMFINLTNGVKMTDSRETYEKFNKLLNPNISEKLSEEEKKTVIKRCKEQIEEFIIFCTEKESEVVYLKQILKVEIIDSVEDKWENGEVVYWLQHSGVVVRQ